METRNKAIMTFQILFFATALTFGGYLLGLREAKKQDKSKILNDHYWEYEGRPQVYNSDFMRLTEAESDSVRLDATNKLK